MHPAALILIAAALLLLLGGLHLLYTFHGSKLHPRDPNLIANMQQVTLVLTRDTTVWRAWIGFNASHSLAAILFGLVYAHLALFHPALLFGSRFLLALGTSFLVGFVVLAQRYWFKIPLLGTSIALASFVSGWIWSSLWPAL